MGNRSLFRKPKAYWFKPYFEEHIFWGLFVFFFRCSSFKTRMKFKKKKNPSVLSIGFKNETSVFINRGNVCRQSWCMGLGRSESVCKL